MAPGNGRAPDGGAVRADCGRARGIAAQISKRMRDVKNSDNEAARPKKPAKAPDWAAGLRQLYDSVVEEPLPDSFRELLSKLDSEEQ